MRCGLMHTVLPRTKTAKKKKGKIDFHLFIVWTDLVNVLIFYGKRNDKHKSYIVVSESLLIDPQELRGSLRFLQILRGKIEKY